MFKVSEDDIVLVKKDMILSAGRDIMSPQYVSRGHISACLCPQTVLYLQAKPLHCLAALKKISRTSVGV